MATVAHNYAQDDVHPLLRHPRPIKRDPAKAHRMLGYLADSEEAFKGLHREKSVTTRWLERPMYEQREAANAEEERSMAKAEPTPEIEAKDEPKPLLSVHSVMIPQEKRHSDSDSDLLDKWINPDRPTSSINPETSMVKLPDSEPIAKRDTSSVTRRPPPLARPLSYNPQHLLTPEWTASPSTMGPETAGLPPLSSYAESPRKPSSTSSRGSCECEQRNPATWKNKSTQKAKESRAERPVSYHPQSFTSFENPAVQPRQRPTSFANYHQRKRSGTKIASSRGFRKDSFPASSSRPPSGSFSKAVSGENIENDTVYQRFGDDEVGPPTPATSISPAIPPPSVFSATPVTPVATTFDSFDKFEHLEEKPKPEKKSKNRWSTIPQALKNLGGRRRDSTAASQETPKFTMVVDDLRRLKLTEDNLNMHEHEANRSSVAPRRQSTLGMIPTPQYSPFDPSAKKSAPQLGAPLPAPFAPWATDAPPSPSASIDYQRRRRSSGTSSLSPKPTPLGIRVESPYQQYQARPSSMHSSMHSPRSTNTSAFPSPHHSSTFPAQYTSHAHHHHHHHQHHQHQPHYSGSSRPPTAEAPRLGTPASRRNTPALERTCILCKTAKPTMEFMSRRITQNCWHEPATCAGCFHAWISRCMAAAGGRGIDACSCPECGEAMSREDVFAATGGAACPP